MRLPTVERYAVLKGFRYSGKLYRVGDLFVPRNRNAAQHRVRWLQRKGYIADADAPEQEQMLVEEPEWEEEPEDA